MYDRTAPLDLDAHLDLAARYMLTGLDEQNQFLPYFHYELLRRPRYVCHGAFDSPHVSGRFLNAIACNAERLGMLAETPEYRALKAQVLASVNQDRSIFPMNASTPWQPSSGVAHNTREVLLGLLAVSDLEGDASALSAAVHFLARLQTGLPGSWPLPGDSAMDGQWTTNFDGLLGTVPATLGRALTPIVEIQRRTGDERVAALADTVARASAAVFEENGQWREEAGTHVHSILNTCLGLAEYALLTGRTDLMRRAEAAYRHGLSPYRTDAGWVKEFVPALTPEQYRAAHYPDRDLPRGEANCSADALMLGLFFGARGDRRGYDDAETILRNHLLASQIVDTSWLADNAAPIPRTSTATFDDVGSRVIGGFCFGSPIALYSSAKERHQVNADLVGGALHGIGLLRRKAVTVTSSRVVAHILVAGSYGPVRVLPHSPLSADPIELEALRDVDELTIELPGWCEGATTVVKGPDVQALPAASGVIGWHGLRRGSRVALTFSPREWVSDHTYHDYDYRFRWRNGLVVGADGPRNDVPLYPPLDGAGTGTL